MGYDERFKDDMNKQFESYKAELTSIIDEDLDALYKADNDAEISVIREAYNEGSLKVEGDIDEYIEEHMEAYKEEQDQSLFKYMDDNILEVQESKSGYELNKFFGVEDLNENDAYAILLRTHGGPNVHYVVGSSGDVYAGLATMGVSFFERVENDLSKYSPLYEFADMGSKYKLGKNEFNMDDDLLDEIRKKDLGYDSVAEYLDQNLTFINEFLIERELLIEYLEKNNLNINDTAEAILTEGAYNCGYYSDDGDGDMVDTTRAQFVAEFEHFADRLEELKNNSDFEDFASLFGIDEDGMKFDADMIEVELDEKFGPVEPDEPTQKVKRKPKP